MFDELRPRRNIRGPVVGITIGLAGLVTSLWFFYLQYWRWRDCFNDLGNCYDERSHINYTEGGMVWGCISIPFFLLACVSAFVFWRSLLRRDRA